jgi:hypothetical protein
LGGSSEELKAAEKLLAKVGQGTVKKERGKTAVLFF